MSPRVYWSGYSFLKMTFIRALSLCGPSFPPSQAVWNRGWIKSLLNVWLLLFLFAGCELQAAFSGSRTSWQTGQETTSQCLDKFSHRDACMEKILPFGRSETTEALAEKRSQPCQYQNVTLYSIILVLLCKYQLLAAFRSFYSAAGKHA